MARELVIQAEVYSADADAALLRLYEGFRKAGDSAEVASDKVAKFEKSYKEGASRNKAKTELDALATSTDKVGAAAGKATSTQAAFNSAILRFVGPAAAGAAIMSTLNWADQLTNLSKSTGISTTSLQKFESIGKLSGATMDQIANASLQLSNRLAGGDKSAAKAMDRLGLSARELIKQSPDKAMLAFAGALAKVENPQERVALAMDGMGRSAGALLPTLIDMNKEWDKTTEKLSEDGVKALDDAGDALDKLMDTGKGLLATVLVPFAPLLEGILTVLTPLSSLFSKFMRDVLSPFNPQAWRDWANSLADAARSMAFMVGIGKGITTAPPPMPGSPGGGFMPQPAGALPLPSNMASIERALGISSPRGATGGRPARVLPFMPRASVMAGTNAASIFGMANAPGGFNAGSLPFMASMPWLQSAFPFFGQASNTGFSGTVPMRSPASMGVGGGGGIGGFLANNRMSLGMMAGGFAAQFLPGRVGQVAQGAMGMAGQGAGLGAMFGPQGAAIGAGIGALVGGIGSLFGGGKAKKNARNAEISEVFAQFSSKEFIAIQKEADRLGVSMAKALNAKTMKDFGAAVDEVTEKIREMADIETQIADLTARTTVGFDQMNAVVKEFGLDIGKMGPAFQQAAIDKEAQRIIDAFAVMEKGGANMSGVLEGMADEISKLVKDSIQFGTTIPENMKPWIDELIKSGKLVDENGQAITDVSKIKWGAAMESDMSKLTKKLDELIQKLGEMADAFGRARTEAEGLSNVDYPGAGDYAGTDPMDGTPAGFATGGVAGRDFRRPGHGDIFPALLRRGERVLPPGAGGGVSIGNITVNGSYGSRADAVEEIGEAVVAYVERRGGRLVA